MYEEYYGLAQAPFNLTPDPRFLYRSATHDLALEQLRNAVKRREGFIVLTGDIGTGKTTVCRTLLEQLDRNTFSALILDPFLSIEELIREMLLSFGVVSRETMRSGRLATASKHELVRTLHDFLTTLVPIDATAVLIIDEAQHLTIDVLEEIRILSNLETSQRKLLQIIIVGQLQLVDLLRSGRLRQLDQRISLRCSLQPLTRDEVEEYVTHRLTVAHGDERITFTRDGLDLVHQVSGGVPRIINLLCDRALMAGREAQTARLDARIVQRAARTLGLGAGADAAKASASWFKAAAEPAVREVRPLADPQPAWYRRWENWRWPALSSRSLASIGGAVLLAAVIGGTMLWRTDASARAGEPAPPQPATIALPQPAAAAPPDAAPNLEPPPMAAGVFTVIAGTFAKPSDATAAVARLRAQKLPVYAVDVPVAEGDVQRRVLVGRYHTRPEAVAAQAQLAAADFGGSRVIFGWQERMRRPEADR